MEAKHTPGPWRVAKSEGDRGYFVEGNLDGGSCEMVCSGIYDIRRADAVLIAAAPELLAALKAFVVTAECLKGQSGYIALGQTSVPGRLARAALAKAGGAR